MLACAVRAPDHGRLRPWRFVVVREAERARFGELLAEHLKRTQPQASAQAVERERDKALRAPLIIVVAARVNPAISKIPEIEQTLSAGAAAQNIMLAAFALGFNVMWKTGGAAYDAAVKRALGLEPTDAIVGFLYVGTEAPPVALPAAGEWRDLVQVF
jgi:nitroreductase